MAKKVALMVGHGKMTNGVWDCGCTYAGYTEAALMLPITKAAVKYLRNSGVTVISDADTNNNRNMVVDVAWANREKVDIYVSVHCDWYKAPSGVFPLYVSDRGKKLAIALNSAIKSGMPMKSRGVCRRTDLYELNATDAPACILETGSIKADIKTLKNADKYGKLIAKGLCNYLGVKFKDLAEPAKTTTSKTTTSEVYRVRKTWADEKSQVGAYTVLANAKKAADEHGLSVFDSKGKAVYTGKKKVAETIIDKEIEACKVQADWMKNYKYQWENNPTIEKSKKKGTCVTYVACVLQRIGVLKSGECIWIDTKGKVYGNNSKMTLTYPSGTLKSNKSKLKRGDIVIGGNGKVGAGAGSHIFVITGKWDGDNPYIYDQASAERVKKGKTPAHTWNGNFKMIARIRLKETKTETKTAYIGHARINEKGTTHGGKPGDQTGKECCITKWHDGKWLYVFRHKDSAKRKKLAQYMTDTCNNNNIGYNVDKPNRYAAWDAAEKNGHDIKGIKTKGDTTCSQAVSMCMRAIGISKEYAPRHCNITVFTKVMKANPDFTMYKSKDYVSKVSKLEVGDILLSEKHTAIVVKVEKK